MISDWSENQEWFKHITVTFFKLHYSLKILKKLLNWVPISFITRVKCVKTKFKVASENNEVCWVTPRWCTVEHKKAAKKIDFKFKCKKLNVTFIFWNGILMGLIITVNQILKKINIQNLSSSAFFMSTKTTAQFNPPCLYYENKPNKFVPHSIWGFRNCATNNLSPFPVVSPINATSSDYDEAL